MFKLLVLVPLLLTLLMLLLRLGLVIHWSWWIVFAPLSVPIGTTAWALWDLRNFKM